ncbi:RICIN domain-containing protein [Sphaerisporangium rubeum]|uniref:RICIN domain-containing protein n=1 Tax=Sphaerisporangium rubeum TaxID=321317 RepID=UPI003CCC9173
MLRDLHVSPRSRPYLIIARQCGFALDARLHHELGSSPLLWPPHAFPHQLWYLRPRRLSGETIIQSVAHKFALEESRKDGQDLAMSQKNGEAWQRWRLEPSADGVAYFIRSVCNDRYLTIYGTSEPVTPGWGPWLEREKREDLSQQWILAIPRRRFP